MDDNSPPEGRIKRGGRRAAVMVDVAKLAGVSYQTVSRVLHDSPHVHRDTRERVLDAIRQLDYRPSSVAQALVTGRSRGGHVERHGRRAGPRRPRPLRTVVVREQAMKGKDRWHALFVLHDTTTPALGPRGYPRA